MNSLHPGPEKVELLNLVPFDQHIFANWTVNGNFKAFLLSIEAANLTSGNYSSPYKNYTFKGLKAGVKYTVTVTTLSEKDGLKSDPVYISDYTSK